MQWILLRWALLVALGPMATEPLAVAVKPEDLVGFFTAPSGLSMSGSAAVKLAAQEKASLTKCGITVLYLQKLRDTMHKVSGMNFPISSIRRNLLPTAYQHPDPIDLDTLFFELYSMMIVPKPIAQIQALSMAMAHAEPYLLPLLYQVLHALSDVSLRKSEAQMMAVNLTLAGADASVLQNAYMNFKVLGVDKGLRMAVLAAVEANLDGIDERYAPNAQPYTAKGFADYYGDSWLGEWLNAPKQKRTAPDGIDYLASEFKVHFGTSWSAEWRAAPVANLRRIAPDGKTYTMIEFHQSYGNAWQSWWFKSSEVLDLCAGLNEESCKGTGKCQWKGADDWTTSCVPRPLREPASEMFFL